MKSLSHSSDISLLNLFLTAVKFCGFFIFSILIADFIFGNTTAIFLDLFYLSLFILSYFLCKINLEKVAYHICIILFFPALLFTIYYSKQVYIALYQIFPIAIIYTFIFFKKERTRLYYLLYLLIFQLLFLKYNNFKSVKVSNEMFIEFLVLVSFNIFTYLMCKFFVFDLINVKDGLNKTQITLQKTEGELSEQLIELKEKDKLMTVYIESNEQLSNFAQLASHELKSPMRNISIYSDLIQKSAKDKLDNTEIEYMQFISGSIKKLNNLIDELTQLSKLNQDNLKIEKLNIQSIIDEVIINYNLKILATKAEIYFDKKVINIFANLPLLRHLFSNLIGNGLKFVEKNKTPVITIISSEQKEFYQFSIQDNGIGIPKEEQANIFNIFTRLHNYESFEGTGIGLSLCEKITSLHNGKIWVESDAKNGSTFHFTIAKNMKEHRQFQKRSSINIINSNSYSNTT